MTDEDREAEDVTGLFRKFGGDASGYREFEPVLDPAAPSAAWPLIPGSRAGAAPVAAPEPAVVPVQPVAPVKPPPAAPARAAVVAPIPAPLAAWAAAPAPAASAPGAPRELDLLFARLAGSPRPAADGGHGLMSRWRKPT